MDAAKRVEDALFQVFIDGEIRTKDLDGTASTAEFASAIIEKIKQ
jgi:isocitrate/isopropylmalate dehydrogenase